MIAEVPERIVFFAVAVVGFSSAAVQTLLIREMLIVFSGNELTIGVVLANWLLLAAFGSYISGRLVDRVSKAWQIFVLLQVIVSVMFLVVVYAVRVARELIGLSVGETMGSVSIFCSSILLLAPVAVTGGVSFTFACRMHRSFFGFGAESSGKVFACEAAGCAVGGLVITFLLIPYFHSIQIALLIGILNLASVSLLVTVLSRRNHAVRHPSQRRAIDFLFGNRPRLLAIVTLVLFLSLSLSPAANELHARSLKIEWANQDLRFYDNSIYSNVAVTQGEEQFTFFVDGLPLLTTPVPDVVFVEEFVHLAMLSHPLPRSVLIVGGGAGGVLQEVLKHNVEKVDYAELDPLIIEAIEKFPTSLTKPELEDPRVGIRHVDGRLLVSQSQETYDVIIVNLPSPSTILLNRFYTKEFFARTRMILTQDGVLAIVAPGSAAYMGEELAYLNGCVYETLRSVFTNVRPIPGGYNIFLASPSTEILSISADEFAQRLESRTLDTKVLSSDHIKYKLDPERLSWFMSSLGRAHGVKMNEDFLPSALFYDLWIWNAKLSPNVGEFFRQAKNLSLWMLLALLAGFLFAFRLVRRRTMGLMSGKVAVAIITTGFSGMAYTIVLMLALQTLFGYVYYLVGLLTATFMTGLAIGSIGIIRVVNRIQQRVRALWKFELAILCFCLLVPIMLLLLKAQSVRPGTLVLVQLAIFALCLSTGVLVGVEFPLANRISSGDGSRVGEIAGGLYASDLLGACLGAILVSVLLLPILGVVNTCMFLAGLKLISLGLIVTSNDRIQ